MIKKIYSCCGWDIEGVGDDDVLGWLELSIGWSTDVFVLQKIEIINFGHRIEE